MRRSACVPLPIPGAPTRIMRAALLNSFVVFIEIKLEPWWQKYELKIRKVPLIAQQTEDQEEAEKRQASAAYLMSGIHG